MLKEPDLRCRSSAVCKECMAHIATCGKGTACIPAKTQLRDYGGIRFTSDGFDCALPVSIDSHSVCSFGCLYCFAPNLAQSRDKANRPIGQVDLKELEGIFSGKSESKHARLFRMGLKYHQKRNGYPCAVQLGAICDPMDNIERNQGWFLKFAELVKKYNQPVRISTKGNLFLEDDYIKAVKDRPELFWVMYSCISADDDVIQKVDKRAPPTSERIECIRRLKEVGVKAGLRFRPIIPGISDWTPKHPTAWKDLIEMAAKAGAYCISYEVAFLPGRMTEDIRKKWQEIEGITGKPLIKLYKQFGDLQACTRPAHAWTEQIMHNIRKVAHDHKLIVGISDHNWKQLGDTGCCCGIPPDDPVFGNWQRESATNRLLEAQAGTIKEVGPDDIVPEWAKETPLSFLVNPGAGPLVRWSVRHAHWEDKLREVWNGVDKERGPLQYFQGALQPTRTDEKGNVFYKFVGLKRTNPKATPFWNIQGGE